MTKNSIIYLSPPMPVSMGDSWFEIASPEHFWIIRRFEVLKKLAGLIIKQSKKPAEIGCGNGALQYQLEHTFGRPIDGFDLNELALSMSVAEISDRFCYNILDRKEELRGKYDLIFLFDIIEHIQEEDDFMQAVLHHLSPGGFLIINVPALPSLYSEYDKAAGHMRRYTVKSLKTLGTRNGLKHQTVSYWGLPMLPLLLARKIMLGMKSRTDKEILHDGFKPPTPWLNRALTGMSRLELLPQSLLGTSVMGVFQST